MLAFIEIVTFSFILLALILSVIPILKKIQPDIDSNSEKIIEFIIKGTIIILKRFYIFLFVTCILVISLAITVHFINNVAYLKLILIIPSVLTSVIAGWLSLKFSMKALKVILSLSKKSLSEITYFCQINSNFILTFLVCFIVLDISIWIIGLNKILTYNIASLATMLVEKMGYQWSNELISNIDFINLKNLFLSTSLAGYVIGSTLHAVLSRFNFSIFATSFDTSADLIGFNKYDFPEDDLRNPGSIPDLIGDQLKNNYLVFSNLHSSLIILIVALSILGSFIGLINHSENSFRLIIFPILFTSFGLLANSVITYLMSFFKKLNTSFFNFKLVHLIFNMIFIFLGVFYLFLTNKIPENIVHAIIIGLFSVIVLFSLTYHLLNIKSKGVRFIAESSNDSILNTITSGLFMGFLISFIISVGICIILGKGVLISGEKVNIFMDFYHIGCIALSLIVGSFPIISETLSKPLIDNAEGISQMLSFDKEDQKKLKQLNANSNVSISFFNIITTITVMFSGCLYLLFYIIKSLKEAGLIKYFSKLSGTNQLDLGTLIHNLELQNFIIPFQVHFLNGAFILGSILGVCFLIGFIALIMFGVSVSYKKINNLTEKELSENPNIFNGTECPNYFNLIKDIAEFSNKFMLISFLVMVCTIIFTWIKIGVAGTIGFVISQIVVGPVFSIFFNISGTLWANSKALIESNDENIGKPVHIAVLFSDKLGDIFKDAIAPIIMDKIKFIILISIMMVSLIIKFDKVVG